MPASSGFNPELMSTAGEDTWTAVSHESAYNPFFLFMSDLVIQGFVIVVDHEPDALVIAWNGVTFVSGTPLTDKSVVITHTRRQGGDTDYFCDGCIYFRQSIKPGGDKGQRQCIHTLWIKSIKRELDNGFQNQHLNRWSLWLSTEFKNRMKPRLLSDRAGVRRYAVPISNRAEYKPVAVCTVKHSPGRVVVNCSDLR